MSYLCRVLYVVSESGTMWAFEVTAVNRQDKWDTIGTLVRSHLLDLLGHVQKGLQTVGFAGVLLLCNKRRSIVKI